MRRFDFTDAKDVRLHSRIATQCSVAIGGSINSPDNVVEQNNYYMGRIAELEDALAALVNGVKTIIEGRPAPDSYAVFRNVVGLLASPDANRPFLRGSLTVSTSDGSRHGFEAEQTAGCHHHRITPHCHICEKSKI